jgi:hypothetical protein
MKLVDSRTGKVIKPIINNSLWRQTTCDVCGANAECTVCSSIFGAFSFAYCQDCFDLGKEPYSSVVNMIACAGPWPEGISTGYQTEVRRQLRLHNKTEEEFIADVQESERQMNLFLATIPEGAIDDQF